MNDILYTIAQVSFYVRFAKIRYQCEEYVKVNLQYFTKPGLKFMCEEKNVKILRSTIKHWEKIRESDLVP